MVVEQVKGGEPKTRGRISSWAR